MSSASEAASFIGILRHRIDTDGRGVVTLAAFHGCPLRCRYCLNPQCFTRQPVMYLTPAQLLDAVRVDHLYFLATGGGVTFGGGEPARQSRFISDFCNRMPDGWHITLETSLHVERRHLERLLPCVHHFIVDIKDTNPDIYKCYTGVDNTRVLDNIAWLLCQPDMQERVTVRLPLIPDYNTPAAVSKSRKLLCDMGVTHFDMLQYVRS